MCVAQFRDYCNAYAHKRKETITSNDEIQHQRGTYYGSKCAWYYTKNKSKMQTLAKQGNDYAVDQLKREEAQQKANITSRCSGIAIKPAIH